jgi:hypothetical protein
LPGKAKKMVNIKKRKIDKTQRVSFFIASKYNLTAIVN